MAAITICTWPIFNPISPPTRPSQRSMPAAANGPERPSSILPAPANSPATAPSRSTPPKYGTRNLVPWSDGDRFRFSENFIDKDSDRLPTSPGGSPDARLIRFGPTGQTPASGDRAPVRSPTVPLPGFRKATDPASPGDAARAVHRRPAWRPAVGRTTPNSPAPPVKRAGESPDRARPSHRTLLAP